MEGNMHKELLERLVETVNNTSSVAILSGDAEDLEPILNAILDTIPDGYAKVEGQWVDNIEERLQRFHIELQTNAEIIRDILVAWATTKNISLESSVSPGEPARNFELAQRLGFPNLFWPEREAKQ